MDAYSHITPIERGCIMTLFNQGHSPAAIALDVYVANLQFRCNSYKKDIHKRYCKKHQNIAGDRKWMPTVILRPLSGVA